MCYTFRVGVTPFVGCSTWAYIIVAIENTSNKPTKAGGLWFLAEGGDYASLLDFVQKMIIDGVGVIILVRSVGKY